jgi:hypothetical protein
VNWELFWLAIVCLGTGYGLGLFDGYMRVRRVQRQYNALINEHLSLMRDQERLDLALVQNVCEGLRQSDSVRFR